MTLHPAAQHKARTEILERVGPAPARLHSLADRPALPYVDALVKEVLRWNCVAPLGLAHHATEDVVWGKYDVPAGACLLFAIRSVLFGCSLGAVCCEWID